ncbi:MAG: hypothetical protein JXR07_08345 [Reichenbachiella sp.]
MSFVNFLLLRALFFWAIRRNKLHLFVVSSSLGVVFFIVLATYAFQSQGKSFLIEYVLTFIGGDSVALRWDVYGTLFKFQFFENETTNGFHDVNLSLRNTIVGAFILFFVIFNVLKQKMNFYLYSLMIFLTSFLTISSLSRSNIIIWFLIIVIVNIGFYSHKPIKIRLTLWKMVYFNIAIVLFSFFIIVSVDYLVPAFDMLASRLLALANDDRTSLVQNSIEKLETTVFIGQGLGSNITAPNGRIIENHNLFLGSWYEMGLLGLLTSVGLYFSIVFTAFTLYLKLIKLNNHEFGFKPFWIMALPILPLFRAMVSGDNGSFTMIDWTALALFFAFYSVIKKI